jgi:hypothetical protein
MQFILSHINLRDNFSLNLLGMRNCVVIKSAAKLKLWYHQREVKKPLVLRPLYERKVKETSTSTFYTLMSLVCGRTRGI